MFPAIVEALTNCRELVEAGREAGVLLDFDLELIQKAFDEMGSPTGQALQQIAAHREHMPRNLSHSILADVRGEAAAIAFAANAVAVVETFVIRASQEARV